MDRFSFSAMMHANFSWKSLVRVTSFPYQQWVWKPPAYRNPFGPATLPEEVLQYQFTGNTNCIQMFISKKKSLTAYYSFEADTCKHRYCPIPFFGLTIRAIRNIIGATIRGIILTIRAIITSATRR